MNARSDVSSKSDRLTHRRRRGSSFGKIETLLSRFSLGLLLAALLPSVGFAQKDASKASEPIVREKSSVTVVEVPVNVIGKDGKPVSNLTAADFELYDEGKLQAITGFDRIDLGRPASGEAFEMPASARRLWLLVFDLSYTSATGLLRARDGARAFVTTLMKPDDFAAVGTLSVDTGWKLLVNFTRDRQQLDRAIETLGLPGLVTPSGDPLAFAFVNLNAVGGGPGKGGGDAAAIVLENLRDLQTMQKQQDDSFARGRVTKLVNSLAGIGRILDSVRGRKHVLFFSEGFETRLLSGFAGSARSDSGPQTPGGSPFDTGTSQGASEAAMAGQIWKVDSDARFGSSATANRLSESLSWFKRSDAVLDAIDINGLRSDVDVGQGKRGAGTDALFTMASETDGDFVKNANQLGPELERVSEKTSLVYLLAFQPKTLSKPGAFHPLKVKVKVSGAKVMARSGYYEPRPFRSLSPIEQLLASGDLITGGPKENAFPVALLTAAFPAGGDLAQVPVVLEISGRSLLEGEKGPKTALEVFSYATDVAGTLSDFTSQQITLDLERARPDLEAGGLKFVGTFFLHPGDYTVRTLVRRPSTGQMSVATSRLRIPAMPGDSAVVLPPFFEEPESSRRWIRIQAPPRQDASARNAVYPFAIEGRSFVPAALAAISSNSTASVAVFAFNFGESNPDALQVVPQVLSRAGEPVRAQVRMDKRPEEGPSGSRKLSLSLKSEGLEPGRYVLRVRISDRVSRRTAESSTPFEVR